MWARDWPLTSPCGSVIRPGRRFHSCWSPTPCLPSPPPARCSEPADGHGRISWSRWLNSLSTLQKKWQRKLSLLPENSCSQFDIMGARKVCCVYSSSLLSYFNGAHRHPSVLQCEDAVIVKSMKATWLHNIGFHFHNYQIAANIAFCHHLLLYLLLLTYSEIKD